MRPASFRGVTMRVKYGELRRDQSGATLITFALTLGAMLGITALAVSAGQAYSTQQKAQNALDAAVLAGAALPYGSADDERISVSFNYRWA